MTPPLCTSLPRPRLLARTCLAVLALLWVLLAPAPSRATALYTAQRLPGNFHPADINNAGQMAGVLYAEGGGIHAALVTDGAVTDLGTFGGTYSYATALNESGAVAGNVGTAAGTEHAFLFQYGHMHDLGAGNAIGMNARGDVVGQTGSATGAAGFLYHDGSMSAFGHLGAGNIGRATGINDAGQIVGESNLSVDAQAPTHPWLYDGGTLHDLGTLANQGVNSAVAINNAGQIAGYSDAGDGRMHAFFYDHGVMSDLGSFGGRDITIGGMNQLGHVVGTGNTPDGPDVPFIFRDSALVDLNTLVDPAVGWKITSALDINDAGQVIAYACRDAQCSAVRLDVATTVPEPRGAWLLLPGLLLLARSRSAPQARDKQA